MLSRNVLTGIIHSWDGMPFWLAGKGVHGASQVLRYMPSRADDVCFNLSPWSLISCAAQGRGYRIETLGGKAAVRRFTRSGDGADFTSML